MPGFFKRYFYAQTLTDSPRWRGLAGHNSILLIQWQLTLMTCWTKIVSAFVVHFSEYRPQHGWTFSDKLCFLPIGTHDFRISLHRSRHLAQAPVAFPYSPLLWPTLSSCFPATFSATSSANDFAACSSRVVLNSILSLRYGFVVLQTQAYLRGSFLKIHLQTLSAPPHCPVR